MGKNKEYFNNGVREFYSVKGCNSCLECTHCLTDLGETEGLLYHCAIKIGRSQKYDRRFPYDNTKCKDFQKQPTEG